MKLTTEQLELISKEIIEGGIKYQDLYEELLDHYVLAIEDRMGQGQTFGEAFGEVHADFVNYKRPARTWDHYGVWHQNGVGVPEYGLGKLQAEYEESLSGDISKRHWEIVKSYFRWPTLVTSLLVGIGTFQCAYLISAKILFGLIVFLSFAPIIFLLPHSFYHCIGYLKKQRKFINSLKWKAISAKATFTLSIFNCYAFIPRVFEVNLKDFPQTNNAIIAALLCFYIAYSLSFYQLYRERFKVTMT